LSYSGAENMIHSSISSYRFYQSINTGPILQVQVSDTCLILVLKTWFTLVSAVIASTYQPVRDRSCKSKWVLTVLFWCRKH